MRTSVLLLMAMVVIGMVTWPDHLWAKGEQIRYKAELSCPDGSSVIETTNCVPGAVYVAEGVCKSGAHVKIKFTCGSGDSKLGDRVAKLEKRHIVGIRFGGFGSQIPGMNGRDGMGAATLGLVDSYPTFFAENVGIEWALEAGGAYAPNGDFAFLSVFEAGMLWTPFNWLQVVTGYQANLATMTYDEVTLQRHCGVVRPRLQLSRHWALEVPVTVGWGTQVWIKESDYTDTEKRAWIITERWTPAGFTWSLGAYARFSW